METIREILDALNANRFRTFLTGFAIIWSIYMLILLVATANGFKHGLDSESSFMAKNTFALYPSKTTKPYNGLQKGRQIVFSEEDIDFFEKEIGKMAKVNVFTPIYSILGANIVYEDENTIVNMFCARPGYEKIRNLTVVEGRLLNKTDEIKRNKVMLIPKRTAEYLFENESPIGKFVKYNDILFEVVGVFTRKGNLVRERVVIPFSTSQVLFNPEKTVTDITFTVDGITTMQQSEEFAKELRELTAKRMNFDPGDEEALGIINSVRTAARTANILSYIDLFLWIIGISTLISGIVGVGNIMIVTVKERTKEFGIRKAMGATPASIVGNTILESLIITIGFGYIGLFLGILTTEIVAKLLVIIPPDKRFVKTFMDPTIDLHVAVNALILLVIVGAIAGFIPAHKASHIKTIDAIMAK